MQTLEELKQEINELMDDRQRYEALSQAKAECYKRIYERKQRIAEFFVNNRMDKTTIDGHDVKAGFTQKFNIKGGKLAAPEKRQYVINQLVEFGYLEEDKVKHYEATEVNEASLQAALRKVPYEMQQKWIEDDLISITPEPKVQIKAGKKTAAA
ncbi:MAG: hypothetical protein OHK0011_00950 [Turneriella sp.]